MIYFIKVSPANSDLTPISGIFFHPAHILCKEVDKMERRDRKAQILNILAKNVRRIIEKDVSDISGLQEIRLRTGQPLRILQGNREAVRTAAYCYKGRDEGDNGVYQPLLPLCI